MKIKLLHTFFFIISTSLLISSFALAQEGHEEAAHEAHGGHEEAVHEEGQLMLSAEQIRMAGIVVQSLSSQSVAVVVSAPGEVVYNRYKTSAITPRINAQLIKRHVVLGEKVKKGQVVATLSSVEMAEAQGKLLEAYQEWQRVRKLGKKIVAERRYIEAQLRWELAKARVLAYGMTPGQIKRLVKSKDFSRANGRFELLALRDGTVIKESFIVGQQVEAGQELSIITDESKLWVTAKISPAQADNIEVGNAAYIIWDDVSFPAVVAQISHTLDEVTRTLSIRLEVDNQNDILHSGLFVQTQITTNQSQSRPVFLVPEAAVMRSADGDWQVFVAQGKAGVFKAVEVDVEAFRNGQALVQGLEEGISVVVKGAFFLQSELAKSGFEIHNH